MITSRITSVNFLTAELPKFHIVLPFKLKLLSINAIFSSNFEIINSYKNNVFLLDIHLRKSFTVHILGRPTIDTPEIMHRCITM